jgi:hypothetical protein
MNAKKAQALQSSAEQCARHLWSANRRYALEASARALRVLNYSSVANGTFGTSIDGVIRKTLVLILIASLCETTLA